MAKNPVFPLYYNDIDRSTRDWTDEEFGCYMRLLMHQWDKFGLPLGFDRLSRIAPSVEKNWILLSGKFQEIDGFLKNQRLEDIRDSLLKYKDKQSENGSKGGRPIKPKVNPEETQQQTQNITQTKPFNEDEDERVLFIIDQLQANSKNKIDDSQKQYFMYLVVEMVKIFTDKNPKYFFSKEADYTACLDIAYHIATLKHWKKEEVVNGKMKECLTSWVKIVDFIKKDDWLSGRSLTDIAKINQWQRLVSQMNGDKDKKQATDPTKVQIKLK